MKISEISYRCLLSANEELLINIGESVSIYDIKGAEPKKLISLNGMRHGAYAAISPDGKILACSNTSGHIAIYSIATGEIIERSKGLSAEGRGLYFTEGSKQIISSTWDGRIFSFCLESGKISVLAKTPLEQTELIPISDGEWLLYGAGYSDAGEGIYKFSTLENLNLEKLHSTPTYALNSAAYAINSAHIYIYGQVFDEFSSKGKDCVFLFDNESGDFGEIAVLDDISPSKILRPRKRWRSGRYGDFTCIDISHDEQLMLLGYSDAVVILSLVKSELVNIIKASNVSSVSFLSSKDKILIGSWSGIHTVNLE